MLQLNMPTRTLELLKRHPSIANDLWQIVELEKAEARMAPQKNG